MQRHNILVVFFEFALSCIVCVSGQATTSSVNPLNAFIGGVQSGAGAIKSAASAEASQTSSSSSSSSASPSTTPPPAPAATTSAAAAHHGLSSGALAGIVSGSIVAAALILGILIGCCCCLMRRRRHHEKNVEPMHDEEKKVLQPTNPGRQYAPITQHTRNGSHPANSHATAPLMGAAVLPHGHSPAPSLSQHPANRQGGNPFAPVPPAPRRSGLNSSHGIPEGAVAAAGAGAAAYGVHKHEEEQHMRDRSRSTSRPRSGFAPGTVGAGTAAHGIAEDEEKQRLRDRSRSKSRTRSAIGTGLPTQNDADRPPTPFGLTGLSQPYDNVQPPNTRTDGTGVIATGPPWSEVRQAQNSGQLHHDNNGHPYGGIGSPYDDMHVHVLQTDAPSRELRHSLYNKTAPFPAATFDDPNHPTYRNSRGYSTPLEVPSRSPNREMRQSQTMESNSSPHSSLSVTTPSWTSDEQYTTQTDPYQPAHPHPRSVPWEQNQCRYSGTPPTSATMSTSTMAAPPIPWEDSGYQNRRKSHSPRASRNSNTFTGNDGRRSSRSPGATSINGQARRLRFEDLQSGNGDPHARPNPHDSFDAQDHARWSQGVGEAL